MSIVEYKAEKPFSKMKVYTYIYANKRMNRKLFKQLKQSEFFYSVCFLTSVEMYSSELTRDVNDFYYNVVSFIVLVFMLSFIFSNKRMTT